MLHMLETREQGRTKPISIIRRETARRSVALQLSKYQDAELFHNAGVNTLDIDLIEQRYLLSASSNGSIAVHDLHTIPPAADAVELTFPVVSRVEAGNSGRHHGSVETVQWYPLDTGMFVSSGTDSIVKVWDTNELRAVKEFKFPAHIYCHHMSSVATHHCLVATAIAGTRVQLIDLKSGSSTHTLRGHRKAALVVQWSPRDEYILATGGDDGQLLMWDVRSARGFLKSFDKHNGDSSAEPNSEGGGGQFENGPMQTPFFVSTRFAVCTKLAVNTAHSGRIVGMQFLPDGQRLLSIGSDQRIRLWDTASVRNTLVNFGRVEVAGRMLVRMATTPIDCGVDVAYVPTDKDIAVFHVEDGQLVGTLRGHYKRVNCAVYCAPLRTLFTGSNDRAIVTWIPKMDEPVPGASKNCGRDFGDERQTTLGASLGGFARRIGGGTADAWSDED